ncbi:hypothetical protein ES703_92385 [subsurface metagenome]
MPNKRRSKAKKPVLPSDISTPKIPTYLGKPNIEDRHIAWRLSSADINGPFSCGQFNYNDYNRFWDRLRAFEKMNVSQFKAAQSFHGVPTTNISKKAKKRLQEILLDDIDIIYGFHITGSCRLWCMRHEYILSVLWWDRNHEVYPISKKHT